MTDQTAAVEVWARMLCAADVHVHGEDHPTWQQLVGEPGRRIRDDYRKAAAWLLPRLTVAPAVPAPATDQAALPAEWSPAVRDAFWTAVNAPTYEESTSATLAFAQMLPAPADRATVQQPKKARPPTAYSDGKGRTYCLPCAPTVGADVPLTINDVDHWDLCPSCGRHVVDVARATEQPKEA